jgi:CubicO group peptidase (beta-lactamase class C family)
MKTKKPTLSDIENHLPDFAPGSMIVPLTQDGHSIAERMAGYHIPGVSIAVIDEFRIQWAQGYGILKAGGNDPVTPQSLFQACSTSKMVTAPIALRMVDQGVLGLDTDVNTYLKSWRVPENEFTHSHKVTLRGLLTHQSGINRPDGGFEWEDGSTPTLVQILRGEAPARVQAAVVEYLPGSKWQYANFGYAIIQFILEDVLGKPFEEIAKEVIFTPLGMKDSTFRYPLDPEWARREISLHNRQGQPTHPGLIPSAVAHGGLLTTPSDLARFGIELMRAYQGQSGLLLSPGMARQMFHQEMWVDDPTVFGFAFGQGLGAFLQKVGENTIVFHPGGNDPGASCLLAILPDTGQGAAIMTNGLLGLPLTVEIISAIAHEYHWDGSPMG